MSDADPCTSVLIVDDDADLREIVAAILSARGYDVEVAADGSEMFDALRSGRSNPGVILLDLRMPGMTGEEVKMALDADPRWSSVPVLVLSGDADAQAVGQQIGAREVVQKPVELDVLLASVDRATRAPGPGRRDASVRSDVTRPGGPPPSSSRSGA